jgi:hypothetical protein
MHGGKNGIIHVSAFAPIESILESGEGFLLFRRQVHRIEYLPKLCVQEVKWYKILNVANRMDVCCSETWSPERNERDRCAIDVRKSSTLWEEFKTCRSQVPGPPVWSHSRQR